MLYPQAETWQVEPGDQVEYGARIASGRAALHAAAAGQVTSVSTDTLTLQTVEAARAPIWPPLQHPTPAQTLARIEDAGIVGLGGGGFPTHLKLLEAARLNVRRLVINAVECEAGISCDAALCEQGDEAIALGIATAATVIGAEVHIATTPATRCCPQAQAWTHHELPDPYTPLGAERHLLKVLFGAEIAWHERPTEHGYLVMNLGTAHAIGRAAQGWPLTARMVTIGTENRWLDIGTPLETLGVAPPYRIGGQLSGRVAPASASIGKDTNAVSTQPQDAAEPCINCGLCNVACPEGVAVSQCIRAPHDEAVLERARLSQCIECGLCGPVCPSTIDVLASLRQSRQLERSSTLSAVAAARAQQRYEGHLARQAQRVEARAARRRARLSAGGARVSSRALMAWVLAALVPGAVVLTYGFGIGVLFNLAIALVAAVLSELLCLYVRRQPLERAADGSVLVTAALIALAVPAAIPAPALALAVVAAVGLGKHAFGGVGSNPFNPAMVGYAVALVSAPAAFATWTVDGTTAATALDALKFNEALSMVELLATAPFGEVGGTVFEWANLAFALTGAALIASRLIGWRVPLSFLLTLAVMALLFDDGGSSGSRGGPMMHWAMGGTMLAAFFVLTDPVTHPNGHRAQLIFGAIVGVTTFVVRAWGAYPDGIAFGVLLANSATAYLDRRLPT